MDILRWFYQLSWKKIIGGCLFLLLIALMPLTIQLVTNQTRTQSKATLIHPSPQAITSKFETPAGPPKIFLVDHFFGKVDDAVLIHGENLGGLHPKSAIYLAGQRIPEENLVSWTGTYIEFKVPTGAKSGTVEVNILGQKTSWPGIFYVIDQNTETEVNFQKSETNPNLAILTATNLPQAQELLVWFLIVSSEGNLKITSATKANLSQTSFSFPIGKIYEIKIPLEDVRADPGHPIDLVKVVKTDKEVVGISRAEIAKADGTIVPIQVNPLYVSF